MKMPNCGAIFGGGILFLMGAIFVALSWGDFSQYRDSQNWIETQGSVYNNEIQSSTDSDGGTNYRARIYYFYYVGDERREGDRAKFGDDIYTGSRSSAEETLQKYPVEATISVYYNPDNPNEVVIERSLSSAMLIFLLVGVAMALIGIIILGTSPLIIILGRLRG